MINQATIDRAFANRKDRIDELSKKEHCNELARTIADVVYYCDREEYQTAAIACAYVFVEIVKRAGLKPYNVLRQIYKAN